MGDLTRNTTTATNGEYLPYMDLSSTSKLESEARDRNLSRHRLGNCVNLDMFMSEVDRNTNGLIDNELPCEFCLYEAVTKALGDTCPWHSTRKDPRFGVLPSRNRTAKVGQGSERRPSWKDPEMNPGNSRSITKTYKFTKKELNAFLPRRSFFSCHDKALKEAGYDPNQPERKQVGRRINAGFQENVDQTVDCTVMGGKLPSAVVSLFGATSPQLKEKSVLKLPDIGHVFQGKRHWVSKSKLKKKMEEDFTKKEYKALTEYFRYIKENQSEYVDHIKRHETDAMDVKPVKNMIMTAMAYQRGHHGLAKDSPVVRASHELKPRYTDPGQWLHVNKEKNPGLTFKKNESIVPHSQDVDSDRPAQEDGKTELERHRCRAEKWLKTVSANQQMKARLMALEELGEEDHVVTQWWNSLQSCRYIRRQGSGEDDG